MAHKENVAALAAKHKLPNPVPHERLAVKRVEFVDEHGETLAIIDGTPMNCASRLWVEDSVHERGPMIFLYDRDRVALQQFFAERWDGDWTPEHRPMMYWFANAYALIAHYD